MTLNGLKVLLKKLFFVLNDRFSEAGVGLTCSTLKFMRSTCVKSSASAQANILNCVYKSRSLQLLRTLA